MDPQEDEELLRTLLRTLAHQETVRGETRGLRDQQKDVSQRLKDVCQRLDATLVRLATLIARLDTRIAAAGRNRRGGQA